MILIKRISDNIIMNDRQSSAWHNAGKMTTVQAQLEALPKNTAPIARKAFQDAIDALTAEHQAWELRRIQAVCKSYGGTPESYSIVEVPDSDRQQAMTARYIEEVDGVLVYYSGPEYTVDGSVVTVNPGWVLGNYRLESADSTDFSGESLTEPLYFRLVYTQDKATQQISVKLFTRSESEEFAEVPGNLTVLRTICEGVVNTDNSVTISEVL